MGTERETWNGVPEELVKLQVKLPPIQVPGAQQGAIVVGDWLALVSPDLQGLSPTSGRWRRQVVRRTPGG